MPRFPLIPTVIVLAAVATMIALGFWQLGRMDEKEALIARYEAALRDGDPRPFPGDNGGAASEADLFHPAVFACDTVIGRETTAARNASGQSGYAQIARCQTERGPADVKLGWSRDFAAIAWQGGEVRGLIVPGGKDGARVRLTQPAPGLEPLAQPDPADLPNNHLAYAGQWFFFALTALVIYVLALRRRQRGG
ncbi:SURF1 family protein [Parerythrobacter aurantius]|uniref:SURF1 family protein n=1 Tax=Parerythrobacter aurantius TaxID=3127706 RepID=UPI00324A981E